MGKVIQELDNVGSPWGVRICRDNLGQEFNLIQGGFSVMRGGFNDFKGYMSIFPRERSCGEQEDRGDEYGDDHGS